MTAEKENQKKSKKVKQLKNRANAPAASHMLWFFVVPIFFFIGWTSYQIIQGTTEKKEEVSTLLKKIEKIENSKDSGARWQNLYSLAENLQKESSKKDLKALSPSEKEEFFKRIEVLMKKHGEDLRLQRFFILSFAHLKEQRAVPVIEAYLNHPDKDLEFFSAWSYLKLLSELKNEGVAVPSSSLEKVYTWLKTKDDAFKKIATSFLVQEREPYPEKLYQYFLKSKDLEISPEVYLNAIVAFSSVGDKRVEAELSRYLSLDELRKFNFRSAKDLEHFVASLYSGVKKLNTDLLNSKVEELKSQLTNKTIEGAAILRALKG